MIRNLARLTGLMSLGLLLACSQDGPGDNPVAGADGQIDAIGVAPNPPDAAATPATVSPAVPAPVPAAKAMADVSSMTPTHLTATLLPGESITEHKVVTLSAAPPKGDVVFAFDLTGSMGGELANTQVNSVNIMNAVQGVIPNSAFGVMSHMDYVGAFAGCGYSSTYGSAAGGDYPYSLDQPVDPAIASSAAALGALSLGYGVDFPENYTRVLYESYADPNVGWRAGSKRIVVSWGDALPHDCGGECFATTYGPDPGRDEVAGTADDLVLDDVRAGMADNDITLIALHSGPYLWAWSCIADTAVQINYDGTVPGGGDLGGLIAGIIEENVKDLDELTLQTCDPAYSDWLVGVAPASYTDIDLDENDTFEFDIEIQVPEGTAPGTYEFDICAIGDGAEYARQHVTIVVPAPVGLDIKPTSCPNPLTTRDRGLLPVAILGGADLDVTTIDPASVQLLLPGGAVAPLRWSVEDVATPFEPLLGKEDCEDCNTEGPDGVVDLSLKFDAHEVAGLLGDVEDGQCLVVTLVAATVDGGAVVGEDVLRIQVR